MLKDITGIKIFGAGFSGSAELQLLEPKDGKKTKTLKGTILYGRNGSGKSTIAKSFKKIIPTEPTIIRTIIFNTMAAFRFNKPIIRTNAQIPIIIRKTLSCSMK